MKRTPWTTTPPPNWPLVDPNDDGIRPAGPPDECFYCGEKVGSLHGPECVVVNKRVRLRYIIEVDVDVPAFWNKDDVEFHRNDGTWCADNALTEIERHTGHIDEAGNQTECLCSRFTATFVGVVDGTPQRKVKTAEEAAATAAAREINRQGNEVNTSCSEA